MRTFRLSTMLRRGSVRRPTLPLAQSRPLGENVRARRPLPPAPEAPLPSVLRAQEKSDATRDTASGARRSRQGRLRRRRLQRQQHGAAPGHRRRRRRDELAGDHPGLAGRDQLRRPELPPPPDHGRSRERARDPDRPAPRPRRQAGDVLDGDRARLHERDDGRLAARRRQDAVGLRLQRRRHARGRRGGAREGRQRRGRARHARRDRGRPRLR